MVDVAGDMCAGASGACSIALSVESSIAHGNWQRERTKCSWNTDNHTLAGQFFGDIDLVAGRVFDQVDVGDGIADFDKGWASRVEEGRLGAEGARYGGCEAAGGKHFASVCGGSDWEVVQVCC